NFPVDLTRSDVRKLLLTDSPSPDLVGNSCPWIAPLRGDKAIEAGAVLLFHSKEIHPKAEALGPAYSLPRHTHGRLRFVEGEAQLEIISCFDRHGTFY